MAVGEALANAIVHGSPRGEDDDVKVHFYCYADAVAVEVGDHGRGLDSAPICAPGRHSPAGRGIHFMRTLTDDMLFAGGPRHPRPAREEAARRASLRPAAVRGAGYNPA